MRELVLERQNFFKAQEKAAIILIHQRSNINLVATEIFSKITSYRNLDRWGYLLRALKNFRCSQENRFIESLSVYVLEL